MIEPQTRVLSKELPANIPLLPVAIRYYDDFSDSYGYVKDPSHSDEWNISFDGRRVTLDFRVFDAVIRPFVKSWCANQLATRAPKTAELYYCGLKHVPVDQITAIITASPQEIPSVWKIISAGQLTSYSLEALKSTIPFMCRFCIGSWHPE